MKIAVIDDYQDAFRKVGSFAKLQGHEVVSYTDSEKDPAKLARTYAAHEQRNAHDRKHGQQPIEGVERGGGQFA